MATCQICGREIKNNNEAGVIAHHGYRRPGNGWQTGSCPGSRYSPYEEDRGRIATYMDELKTTRAAIDDNICRWENTPPASIRYEHKYGYANSRTEWLTVPRPDTFRPVCEYFRDQPEATYAALFYAQIAKWRQQIDQINAEIVRLQARYDNWKLHIKLV